MDLQPATLTVDYSASGVGARRPIGSEHRDGIPGFGSTVAAYEGIDQGASGSTSWKVTVVLEAGQTILLAVSIERLGVTSALAPPLPISTRWVVSRMPTLAWDGILVFFYSLTVGSSAGEVGGGFFHQRGWMATAADTYIRYRVPTLPNGFVEFDVTNLRNPNP